MKKKLLGVFLIAIIVATLAGCSLTYDGQDVNQPEKQEQQEKETTKEEKDGCLDDGLFY